MLFSSITFLYTFLPIVLLVYFVAPKSLKNGVLLLASLIFYGWSEPKYVVLMVVAIVLGYVWGLLIEKYADTKWHRVFLTLSIVTSVGILGVFKYANFFVENISKVTGLSVPVLNIALPIGISFYTFQLMSYNIDVYRGQVGAQKNIVTLATYVALFPQLIAGPIVRYSDIEKQLVDREISWKKVSDGATRFVVGLSKKVLIANQLGELCDVFKSSGDKSVAFYWLYAVAFTLHIYFDFSGYSDMAIGLGRIFGFDFIENFNYPYISKSVTEFWRRWHISLGSWFRDYVYIPLGGNRTSKAKWLRNIFVVWFLTGMWHGASWNFIIWGLMMAVLLLVEKTVGLTDKKAGVLLSALKHFYVMIFIIISFVIFNADNMVEAFSYLGGMVGVGTPFFSREFLYYLRSYGIVLVLAILGATPFVKNTYGMLKEKAPKVFEYIDIILACAGLILPTAYLVDGSFNPFLYFRF